MSILFYGSFYLTDIQQPFWHSFLHVGDFSIKVGLIDMFCNLGLGCLMYVDMEALRDREFSKPFSVLVTIVQAFLWCSSCSGRSRPPTCRGTPFRSGAAWPTS